MSDLIKAGALWRGTTKAGKAMLSGNLNRDLRILVMENSYKEKENDPDYILYVTKNEKPKLDQDQDQSQEQTPATEL